MTWLYWISTICAMIPCMQFCNIWEKWGKCVISLYIYGIFVGRRTSYTSNSPTSTLVPFETEQGLKGIHQVRLVIGGFNESCVICIFNLKQSKKRDFEVGRLVKKKKKWVKMNGQRSLAVQSALTQILKYRYK